MHFLRKLLAVFLVLQGGTACCFMERVYAPKCIRKKSIFHQAMRGIGEIIVDALMINLNLFALDSVKIATATTPFYLATRMSDEHVHSYFYDYQNHKNICQLPDACHTVAQCGVGVPMVFLSSLALWGWTDDLRMTGRIFALGLPFVHSGKDLIKQMRFKSCLRPWNEHFSKDKRCAGGFPSGHMANVAYMTTLFGMRHGLAWGVPLGLFATFVFADFLNCNRHYLSQLVAGTGLGVMFAFAANKVISQKLASNISFDCKADTSGATFKVRYTF